MGSQAVQRRLTAILSADVVGYSRLMGEDEAGTLDGVDHARKLHEGPVAHQFDEAPAARGDRRVDALGAMRLEARKRPRLVLAH